MSALDFITVAPHSKKNRPVIICPFTQHGKRKRGLHHHVLQPSAEAREDEAEIRYQAEQIVHALDRPLFPGDDVSSTFMVDPRTNQMAVRLESMGARPKGFSGRRRDLHSHLDVFFDAIQGVLIQNDNQIAEIYIRRELGL